MTVKEQKARRKSMFKLVEEFLTSGQSQSNFSKTHGIARSTFQSWCSKYHQQKKQAGQGKSARHFMPVQLTAEANSTLFSAEIVFPNGVCLKLSNISDVNMVGRLVNSFHHA